QFSPSYLLNVAMVRNEGAYAKAWWWYYNLTASELSANLTSNSARLIDFEVYEISNGELRFTAIMVSNTGAENKAWWWYYNAATITDISNLLTTNNARLIDLDSYYDGGLLRYNVAMIRNTGADAKAWWWYVNQTPAQIGTLLQNNSARLIDIERYDPSDTTPSTYNVVMEACPCPYWWWYIGVTESTLSDLLAQNGARLIDIEPYPGCGGLCFNAIMINNSNAITSRVGNLLRSGTDGATGLYLKPVGGPVLAWLQADRVFEPASTIKVVQHLYAMQQVENGSASLAQSVPIYADISGSCPGTSITGSETLSNALRLMMWNSDNERTKAISVTFGIQNINNMAQSIGMADTRINHTMGCAAEALANPNRLALDEAGLLYEGVANGTLLNPVTRDTFFYLMAGKGYDFTGVWQEITMGSGIIDQEAPAGMTASQKQSFAGRMKLSYKAGGYTLCDPSCLEYRSIAGWAEVPFCTAGAVAPRQYVFGIFIDGATSGPAADNTFNDTKAELLREQINSALSTWAPCAFRTFLPIIIK
ncbi:MAG TPA: serine hydrolase, partial [Anaerolineae bacterium]|nr:serine hydrolase [Anaerolineae bacterium]